MKNETCITSWDNVPILMDIPYVCSIVGLSDRVIYKLIYSNRLKARKVGGSWRVNKRDLMEYVGAV